MKHAIILMLAIISLSALVNAVEVTGDLVKDMKLKRADLDGAVVYYDRRLEKLIPVLSKTYSDYRQRMSQNTAGGNNFYQTFTANKTAIMDDVISIVGGTDETRKFMEKNFSQISELGSDLSLPLTGSGNTIYLVMQTVIKDYLRKGGSVPNIQYDKEADEASYQFFFELGKDNSSNQEALIPLVSSRDKKGITESIFFNLHNQVAGKSKDMDYIMIHEVAEMAILRRLKSNDPYVRWFSDGFANAITREMLKKYFTQKDVDDFLATNSAAKYDGFRKEANLQYWMSLNYVSTNDWPVRRESELSLARYCFATELALEIVDAHGIDCVGKIIEKYLSDRDVTANGVMPDIIAKYTGFNVREKMLQYQKFKTVDDGIAYYDEKLKEIDAEKDPDDKIYYLMRKLELIDDCYSPKALYVRIEIGNVLYDSGRTDFARRFVTDFADDMCRFWDGNINTGGLEFMIFFSLGVDEPEWAVKYADDMLKGNPDHTNALAVVMKTTKDKQQARKLAEKIIGLEKDIENFCYIEAQKLLEK